MKGISKRRTRLGFNVLRMHYTCDEDKDPSTPAGRKWLEEARKGMSDARWQQEYEISYEALGGQLVFPEFNESIHSVDANLPLSPEDWSVWLAADPHPRRAHAFVFLAVNRHGEMVVPWSLWPEDINREREAQKKNRLLIKEYVEMLRDLENAKLFPPSYIELMDQAGANFNADEQHNFFDAYAAEDVIFRPAKRNREYSGYTLISKALTPEKYDAGGGEVMRPRLTIFNGCGHNHELVRQLKTLRFREFHGNVTDKDKPSDPMNKDRHLIDCLSYILLDSPEFVDTKKKLSSYEATVKACGY